MHCELVTSDMIGNVLFRGIMLRLDPQSDVGRHGFMHEAEAQAATDLARSPAFARLRKMLARQGESVAALASLRARRADLVAKRADAMTGAGGVALADALVAADADVAAIDARIAVLEATDPAIDTQRRAAESEAARFLASREAGALRRLDARQPDILAEIGERVAELVRELVAAHTAVADAPIQQNTRATRAQALVEALLATAESLP